MKSKVYTILFFALPFLVSAQTLTINSGANVTIGPGATVTTGEIVNNAGNSGLVIESVASGTQGNIAGSLIYSNPTTEPDATVQVYVKEQGWHFVSSPTGNTTSDVFLSESDDVWLAEYIGSAGNESEPDYPWSYITETDYTINKGQGYSYAVNYSSRSDNNISFTGKLVSELFASSTLNYEDTDNTNPNNFTLLGNPFSSPIDVALLDPTETTYELTIWIWDQTLNSGNGGYQWASFFNAYNPPDEMLPTSIAIGQGFYIRALQASATIDFDPDLRAHESAVEFFKEGSQREQELDVIEFSIEKDDKKDFGAITFGDNGSTGFENGWDVTKMLSRAGNPEIYFMEEGNRYCLNHLTTLNNNDDQIVNLHLIVGESGEQKLSANLEFLPDTEVYLEDLSADKMINLNQNPVYTFNAKKGDNTDRFKVHFKYSPTGLGDLQAVSNIDVYAANKAVYITNKENDDFSTAKIAVYDMFGRTIYTDETRLSNITRIPLDVNNSYLIVKVINGNKAYTEKVFIK